MAGDSLTELARLEALAMVFRAEGGSPRPLADTLSCMLHLHVNQGNADPAAKCLEELGALRRPGEPTIEAAWYLGAAMLASTADHQERAVWLGAHAISLSRRHRLELLPHALIWQSDFLQRLGRDEESGAARVEAVERFEQTGQGGHAAAALVSMHDASAPDTAPLRRAVELAERQGDQKVKAWALKSLGEWHLERREYLPARRALDRSLVLAREHAEANDVSSCLTDLAWLEGDAQHHEAAVRFATEAVGVATTPFWKGYALEAREAALRRLHRHEAARADLLEAARCFDETGDLGLAMSCRQRARAQRIYAALHRLPAWMFKPEDSPGFQPFLVWMGAATLTAIALWAAFCFFLASRLLG